MESGLTGKSVLITGASGGIGRETARSFLAEGARVLLHSFKNKAALADIERDAGASCLSSSCDLRDEAGVDRLFAEFRATAGRIDALVVNAGVWVSQSVPLHEMSLEQWQATMASDLTSAFLTCRGFLRQLAAMPGPTASIVLVASTAALFGEAGHCDYAAAKAAMAQGMTLTLKNEIVRLAERGRVNCVCPGWVETAMTKDALQGSAEFSRISSTMPLAKLASTKDIARTIVYLSSDELAGHVSGAILPVAGGMEGRLLVE